MMTRAEYLYFAGLNFEGVKDLDKIADDQFMQAVDRVTISLEAFESEYCDLQDENYS